MKVQAITKEDILNADCKDYNPAEWIKTIDRYSKYKDLQFYKEIEGPFSYERFFATYQLPEGLKLFKSVSYSGSLSNAGFKQIVIRPDGQVQTFGFGDTNRPADNTPGNRKLLAKMEITITNEL